MKQILYMPSYEGALSQYEDWADLERFYRKYGCQGLELIRCSFDEGSSRWVRPSMVCGVHMIFYPAWLDFYLGREEALNREFGSREVWEGFYGGAEPSVLLRQFSEDLEYAKAVGAEYVVFHVSEVTIPGVFTHCHHYSHEEVIAAAIQIINQLLDGKDYQFDFLMENLWWPGLTMTEPKATKQLLEGVSYKRKGIMLDLGHLMCSNMELTTEEEAIAYVHRMLDEHQGVTAGGRPLTDYIKGVHMHQSVTGAFAKRALHDARERGLKLADGYYERFAQVYELLGKIDTHKPFSRPEAAMLIERIAPKYLVHELMAANPQEREAMLAQQSRLLLK